MPSKHLILCHPLLLPSIFPSIRVFSNELAQKESLGLEKKTTVSNALAESSNFGENKTELMLQDGWIYLGLITPCPGDLSPPAQNLPPPVQLQMPSQLKINPKHPTWHRFHKPPFKYEASLIPLHSAWSLGQLLPLLAWIKVTYLRWGHLSFFSASAGTIPYILIIWLGLISLH